MSTHPIEHVELENQPAQSLDNLPRPGVAITLDRWLSLLAIEQEVVRLREDKARLDFLDAEVTITPGKYPVIGLSVKMNYVRNSSAWANITGTARAAIDDARKH